MASAMRIYWIAPKAKKMICIGAATAFFGAGQKTKKQKTENKLQFKESEKQGRDISVSCNQVGESLAGIFDQRMH